MAYGLPSRGQRDWDDEIVNSIEAVNADAQSAKANASNAVSTANQAINIAQSVQGAVLGGADVATAGFVEDDASQTAQALRGSYARFGPTPQAHGAKGDGSSDDTTALQAWLAAGYTEGFVPPGTYLTTATLTQPATMDVTFAEGATIKASATITGPVWDTPVGTLARNRKLVGAHIDCDNKAQTGIYVRYAAHFKIDGAYVLSPTVNGLVLGDPASAGASYEVLVSALHVDRPSSGSVPTGSRGLWMQFVQDSRIVGRNIIQGVETGVRMDRGSNQFHDVHVWGYQGKQPTVCFDDNAGHNLFIGCMADSPTQYGWRHRTFRSRFIGCHFYTGQFSSAPDNTVIGLYVDLDAPEVELIGCLFEGADGSRRLAKDVDGASSLWKPYVTAVGARHRNVATRNLVVENQQGATRLHGALAMLLDSANALQVRDSSGLYSFNINTNAASRRIEAHNGAEMRGYSDAGTTQQWRISSQTGAFRLGRYTTAARPTGSAVQQDDYIHDLTLGKLIRWDGTNWRDTMNTIV